MRGSKNIVIGVIVAVTLCGAAFAAPATSPTAPASASSNSPSPPADTDCQKLGGDVSALIDTGKGSPNISAAKAVFQRGIMECMEGDDQAANTHYREVVKLLGKIPQKTPAAPPKS